MADANFVDFQGVWLAYNQELLDRGDFLPEGTA